MFLVSKGGKKTDKDQKAAYDLNIDIPFMRLYIYMYIYLAWIPIVFVIEFFLLGKSLHKNWDNKLKSSLNKYIWLMM